MAQRCVALVTGASRPGGIGAACSRLLARAGWDIALAGWSEYDRQQHNSTEPSADLDRVLTSVRSEGAAGVATEVDLGRPDGAVQAFDAAERELGGVSALVLAHCVDLPGSLMTTTPEEFELHFAVNVRASWLLMRELASRLPVTAAGGRIVALTSDALDTSVAYGASKGALDRLVLAAARQFGDRGITANAINPGPTDTGWIDDSLRHRLLAEIPLGRIGSPEDCARLVVFLCSDEGGFVSGQLLHSDGGLA